MLKSLWIRFADETKTDDSEDNEDMLWLLNDLNNNFVRIQKNAL